MSLYILHHTFVVIVFFQVKK